MKRDLRILSIFHVAFGLISKKIHEPGVETFGKKVNPLRHLIEKSLEVTHAKEPSRQIDYNSLDSLLRDLIAVLF